MSKFKITVIPDSEPAYSVEIEADRYCTQATQGAGMIADFQNAGDDDPFATFARVLSVQRIDNVEDQVILSRKSAQWLAHVVKRADVGFRNDPDLKRLVEQLE